MQADLFNLSLPNSFERDAFHRSFFEKKYTLRLDQCLGIGLVLIVFFVLVFAWGVERGKAVSQRDFVMQRAAIAAESSAQAEAARATPVTSAPVVTTPLQSAAPVVEVAVENKMSASAAPQKSVESPVARIGSTAKYTIAHIIYFKKDLALREIDKIKARRAAAFLVSSGKYFQVCVGGFESHKAANEGLKDLRSKGIVSKDAYVRNKPA